MDAPIPQPISTNAPPAAAAAPLTSEQLESLQRVGAAYRVVRRAANIAAFSGITELVLGVGAAGCLALSPDVAGVIATAVLLAVGIVELVGRHRLLRGSADALRILSLNQLAFLAAIAIYCGVQILTFSTGALTQELSSAAGGTDVAQLIDVNTIHRLNSWFYASVIVVGIASQGGLAWYYARRQKHLDAFRAAEPWQRNLLQTVSV